MKDLIEKISPHYKTTPLVLGWVLANLAKYKNSNPQDARRTEQTFFDGPTLKWILENADVMLLSQVFAALDPACFDEVLDAMIEKWPEWTGITSYRSGLIISSRQPAAAATLFKAYCRWDMRRAQEPTRVVSVLSNLKWLSSPDANAIFDLIRSYLKQEKRLYEIEEGVSRYMFEAAVNIGHPETESLLRDCLVAGRTGNRDDYDEHIEQLLAIMGYSPFEYRLIDLFSRSTVDFASAELAQFFHTDLKTEVLITLAADITRRRYSGIVDFMQNRRASLPEKPWARFLEGLALDDRFLSSLHKKKQRPLFFKMLLAINMNAYRLEALDLDGRDADTVVKGFSLELGWLNDKAIIPQVAAYLKGKNRETVVEALTVALETATTASAANGIMAVMVELEDPRFIDPLVDLLINPRRIDINEEHIVEALAHFGESSVHAVSASADKWPDDALIWILELLARVATPAIIPIIDAHFARFWETERRLLMDVLSMVPTGPWRHRLVPMINHGQIDIDRTYLLLTILNGTITVADQKLMDQVHAEEKENIDKITSMLEGSFEDLVGEHIDILLKCPLCGDKSHYRVHSIYVNPEAKCIPYIAEDLTCVKCGQACDFEITAEGHQAITVTLMATIMIQNKETRKTALQRCPVKIMSGLIQGQSMDIGEGVDLYRQQIAEDPDNVEALIGLANIYRNTGQTQKARAFYWQTIAIAPEYIECFYNLAQMAEADADIQQAIALLDQGMPYLRTAKKKNAYDGSNHEDMSRAYIDYHRSLKNPSSFVQPHPTRSDEAGEDKSGQKVGRNALCPCGSGKKYKKCCLNTSSS